MLEILAITTPIFTLIGMGYLAVRLNIYPKAHLSALGAFVIRIALPVLVFKSISQRSFAEVMNFPYLGAYLFGSLLMLGVGLAWAKLVRGQDLEQASLIGMGMCSANSAYVGYPIAVQVIGPTASMVLALSMIVENMLVLPLCLALGESGGARHEPFWRVFGRAILGLRKSSLVVAIFAAFLFSLFQLGLPAQVNKAVDMLAGASAPVALFFIGGSLVGLPLKDVLLDVGVVSFAKLVLHPLAVLGGLWLFGPVDPLLAAGAILLASAPMLSIYPIFGQRHGKEGFCAATLLVATVAAFVTIATVIWLLHASGMVAAVR
ncbi:MAG: AEC family transporter [Zoogloea sp.]|nr:AEC family transporter [Zoogloea sp.]